MRESGHFLSSNPPRARRSIAITSVCGLIVLILTCSVAALAEENPKVEVFGGFSLRETQPPPVSFPTGPFPDYLAGWHFSVAGRLNPYLLLVTEASANSEDGRWVTQPGVHQCASTVCVGPQEYVPGIRTHAYLFGPRGELPVGSGDVFAHVLAGPVHKSIEGRATGTGLGFGLGGGFDMHLFGPAIGRIQLDWIPNRSLGPWETGMRYTFGIGFRFGS